MKVTELLGVLCAISIGLKTCYGELIDENNSNGGNCEHEKQGLREADQDIKIANLVNKVMAQNVKIANLESTIIAQNAKINVKVANMESAITAQNAKITSPERSIAAQNVKIANLETAVIAQSTEFEKLVNQLLERRISQITSDYRFHERLQQETENRRHLNESQNALAKNMKALETNHSTSIDELKGTQSVLREKMEMCFEKQSLLESDLQKIVNETAELGLQMAINNIQIRRNTDFTRSLKMKDCQDVQSEGNSVSGVYDICVHYIGCISVYCDMDTDGGGWTVFQHRYDGSVDFYRTWADYKTGFGNLHGEFWLGNENIHKLSSQNNYKLRINLKDIAGSKKYAEYSSFVLENESQKYMLHIGSYSGNAGDSLAYHNNRPFSTRDRDSDSNERRSCAVKNKGAWWYGDCDASNLNGLYSKSKTGAEQNNVWQNWSGGQTNMKSSTMMIRRI